MKIDGPGPRRRGEQVQTIGIVLVFLIMLAAPCMIAMRSSRRDDEAELLDSPKSLSELDHPALPNPDPFDRPLTLAEQALRAEADARTAQELAREAHCAALAAAAHAARLRADAAVEAAYTADHHLREAAASFQADYLPPDHPSLDFPRSRPRRAA